MFFLLIHHITSLLGDEISVYVPYRRDQEFGGIAPSQAVS